MAKRTATFLGIVFLIVGVVGFVMPDVLGMHLSMVHSIIHLATGTISLVLGLRGSLNAARMFCIGFGIVYALLGIAGFALGTAADPAAGVPGPHDARLFKVVPGMLELGTMDHPIHIALGAIFIISGFMTRTGAAPAARA